MTDTKTFRTIVINKKTGEWKTFWNFFPCLHAAAARRYLRSI